MNQFNIQTVMLISATGQLLGFEIFREMEGWFKLSGCVTCPIGISRSHRKRQLESVNISVLESIILQWLVQETIKIPDWTYKLLSPAILDGAVLFPFSLDTVMKYLGWNLSHQTHPSAVTSSPPELMTLVPVDREE